MVEIKRRIRLAWKFLKVYSKELYGRKSASLEVKVGMLKADVPETMLYEVRIVVSYRPPLQ